MNVNSDLKLIAPFLDNSHVDIKSDLSLLII